MGKTTTCGIAVLIFAVMQVRAAAQSQTPTHSDTFRVLYTFSGGSDGALPSTGLLRDAAGNLYGTTIAGGDPDCNCGVVFEVSPTGKEHVLYTFTGDPDGGGPDGSYPQGDLTFDREGNLYGTTTQGGDLGGVVFKLDRNGNETVLHKFEGPDGAFPFGLTRDAAGRLFGVTFYNDQRCGCGTVYGLNKNGHVSFYAFSGKPDGANPEGDVAIDHKGNLYGTTSAGGKFGSGAIFKIDRKAQETVLHSFSGADGADPVGGLVLDEQGNAYGTTYSGGAWNSGVVFKLNQKGEFTVLYNFMGGADGGGPLAQLVRDSAGNLFGTAYTGGDVSCVFISQNPGCGVVFELDPRGTETVLYTFENGADGSMPQGKLTLDRNGNLYGTATLGNNFFGTGVVFELTR